MNKHATLLSNASATGDYVAFAGGRASLVVEGTLPTTFKLQVKGKSGGNIDVATITAAGITSYDLPPGEYRMSVSGGSPAALYAHLYSIPHN